MAAITPDRLKELMLKIRKGATSSFNLAQVAAVVEALGGSLRPVASSMDLQAPGFDSPASVYAHTPENAVTVARQLSRYLRPLPVTPKPGELYLRAVAVDPREGTSVDYEGSVGVTGVRVEFQGESEVLLPNYWSLSTREPEAMLKRKPAASVADVVRWLADRGWVRAVNAYLNLEEHTPAAARTRDNTGSCGACFANVKLTGDLATVLHGYERPGEGFVKGKCPGTGYLPYELSADATSEFLRLTLRPNLKLAEGELAELEDDKVLSLPYGTRTVRPGDPGWSTAKVSALHGARSYVEALTRRVEAYERLVQHWVQRPLPREGERHIDWFTEGQR